MPADSFESPLTLAACGGHVELAMLLLERGANIEEVNDEGYTPLMEASREGHEEMVALLLSQGEDNDRNISKIAILLINALHPEPCSCRHQRADGRDPRDCSDPRLLWRIPRGGRLLDQGGGGHRGWRVDAAHGSVSGGAPRARQVCTSTNTNL